jgi:DNA-binding MarR family transcriptional regulator
MSQQPASEPALNEEQVALFCRAVGVAPRKMGRGAEEIVSHYNLGQRGVWIMALINVGQDSPSRLSDALCIGRSLFTAELNRLTKAGLVAAEKDSIDGRRLKLRLTAKGVAANQRLQKTIIQFMNENLAGFSKDDVLLCARLLLAFAGTDADRLGPAHSE